VFAALGDETRLSLVTKLCAGQPLSKDSNLTRQAITKHLRALERAGVVRGVRTRRENPFAFDVEPIDEAKSYLDLVLDQWNQALARLKSFVED